MLEVRIITSKATYCVTQHEGGISHCFKLHNSLKIYGFLKCQFYSK